MQPNNDLQNTRNTARFFTEQRQLAWVFLVLTLVWGVYSYWAMPKRKDPEFQVNVAVAICVWPARAPKRSNSRSRASSKRSSPRTRASKKSNPSRATASRLFTSRCSKASKTSARNSMISI